MTSQSAPKNTKLASYSQTPEFWLIGGFLGAGKTTCLVVLSKLLQERGRRVGLITNDQGQGLVDSAIGKATTTVVREVIGGCFCCRVGELVSALKDMQKGQDKPDVFLAEPVGSCTDLMATVLLPLEQAYGSGFRKAPMSVVVDAKRAWTQYFGNPRAAGKGFSKDVMYIYLKQLEEAEIIVLNKVDLLKPKPLADLLARLKRDWPEKRVLTISARSGEGCEAWLDVLMKGAVQAPSSSSVLVSSSKYTFTL